MKYLKFIFILGLFILFLTGCKPKTYTVKFISDSVEVSEIQIEKNNSLSRKLPIVVKEGYNLDGWYFDTDYVVKYEDDDPITKDTTLYAKWSIKQLTVKFMNGNVELKTGLVDYGSDATAPTNPTKIGHVFKEWDKAFTNVKTDLIISAVYDKVSYEVKFMDEDTQIGESQFIDFGDDAIAPTNPTKVGYVFLNWNIAYTDVQSDLIVLAVFEILTFEVKFMDAETQIGDSQIIDYGSDALTPAEPTKLGYRFLNWDIEYTNVQADLVVTAVFEILSFEVKFMDGETQIEDTQYINFGDDAIAPANPSKIGHTFLNWDIQYNDVQANLIVLAVFEKLSYEVIFMDGNTQIGDTQYILFQDAAVAPTPPTKLGLTFVGWDIEFTNITTNITVSAIYETSTFQVKFFDLGGNQLGETQTIEYNQAAVAPNDPEKVGYEFKNWDKDFANVTTDLNINAVYDIITYDIEYFDGDTSLIHTPDEYNVATSVTLVPITKVGFTFIGWFLTSEFTDEAITSIPVGHTGDKTFYGQWIADYQVNYELNGGAWAFTESTVALPATGINNYSNLPQIFMLDFYTYLKDNDLLSSTIVHSTLRKTNWAEFSANYTDPVAIYNHTTTNTSTTTNGYSQFFYDTATGDITTGELLTINGGFFGTEPYKTKYFQLARHISLLQFHRAYGTQFWAGPAAKSLAGFLLDGYFYGTQGISGRTAPFVSLRGVIVQPHLGYKFSGTTMTTVESTYLVTSYGYGVEGKLHLPSKDGFIFAGWYSTSDFSTERVYSIPPWEAPAPMYYAKWIAAANY